MPPRGGQREFCDIQPIVVFMQWNYMLPGCDGRIARVMFWRRGRLTGALPSLSALFQKTYILLSLGDLLRLVSSADFRYVPGLFRGLDRGRGAKA
jgi:hypothetical protein